MKKIRWKVFLPPWLLMVAVLVLNLTNYKVFVQIIDICTNWILSNFTGGFCVLTFVCVILVIVTYFSPMGKVKIGGRESTPIVSYKNYIWIVLCTVMAAGILLWACSEPMYHIYQPPDIDSIKSGSQDAVSWAMNTMFLEWTITPLCIYGLPAILFAFVFYNMKKQFSIGSMLIPAIGEKKAEKIMPLVDAICLFALCAGMAASLGQGVLLFSGGVESYSNGMFTSGSGLWLFSTILIVVMFVISASTGVTKGIQKLSNINSVLFLIIGFAVLLLGPTGYIINLGLQSLGKYFGDFCEISLFTGALGGNDWVQSWPGFYWCNWMAWMPVTAVFLGKISRGYTVRQMIQAIVVIPSIFSMVWISLFSGASIYLQMENGSVYAAMESGGPEAATYAVLGSLPLSKVLIGLFLIILVISFVTAADSNTNAMSSLCTSGLTPEDTESPMALKIIWGFTIGAICFIMLVTFGVDGIKKLSNLGGFPDAFLMVIFIISWIRILKNPQKYSKV